MQAADRIFTFKRTFFIPGIMLFSEKVTIFFWRRTRLFTHSSFYIQTVKAKYFTR
jgi:hypothetical protein